MAGLIFLWLQDGGVIPPDPPVIVLNPMGGSGDADDGFFAPVRRPNLEPQPEVIKKPYLQTLKEISKDEPEQKPKPKRKKFKEPQVEYRKPKLKATGAPAPERVAPTLSEPDPFRLQRIQAFADKQREAREKANFIAAQNELSAQIENERALMAQHLEKLLVEQDDRDAAEAVVALVNKGVI